MVVEVAYTGSWSRTNITRRLDSLPANFWATGKTRNSAIDTQMNQAVANPYNYNNLSAIRSSDPMLYNYLRNQSRFSTTTIQKNELLRPCSQVTRLQTTTNPDGRVRYNAAEFQFEKRFSRGFMFNVLYTYTDSETRDWYANEFDALPTWRPNNNTMPHRFVFTGIYELPFGHGKALLKQGVLGHVIGGWQLSTVYQRQSGPAIDWGNEFYSGAISNLEKAFNSGSDIHQWFDPNVPFEKDSAKRPGTYHVRVFPGRIGSLRADGINNLDLRILRNFNILPENRLRAQLSVDMLNAINHTNFSNPNVNVRDKAFGTVSSQRGLSRIIQANVRFVF